jgi:lipase chaperone LimK
VEVVQNIRYLFEYFYSSLNTSVVCERDEIILNRIIIFVFMISLKNRV